VLNALLFLVSSYQYKLEADRLLPDKAAMLLNLTSLTITCPNLILLNVFRINDQRIARDIAMCFCNNARLKLERHYQLKLGIAKPDLFRC
jgi:hypothetical protein